MTKTETGTRRDKLARHSGAIVARRCIVLIAVIDGGHNRGRSKLLPWLKREGLLNDISPQELRFLRAKSPARRDRMDATWQAEALIPLLWAIRRLPRLPSVREPSRLGRKCMPFPGEPTAEFIANATLRSHESLEREQERVYIQHWKVRDAYLNGRKPPRGLDPEVIPLRHRGFNWLVDGTDQCWDDVTTDT